MNWFLNYFSSHLVQICRKTCRFFCTCTLYFVCIGNVWMGSTFHIFCTCYPRKSMSTFMAILFRNIKAEGEFFMSFCKRFWYFHIYSEISIELHHFYCRCRKALLYWNFRKHMFVNTRNRQIHMLKNLNMFCELFSHCCENSLKICSLQRRDVDEKI